MILDYRDRGKIGFTCSTFDLLHAGHITMLEEASRQCDFLVVGLQNDPTMDRPDTKNSPVQTLVERQIQLSAVKYVDEIIPYVLEQDVQDILRSFKIDVRIIGEEYKTIDFTGKEYCIEKGIEIHYNSREHRFSSTEIKTRLKK